MPRTGEISTAELSEDLLSIKAFIKEGIRVSQNLLSFTHWLPVYIPGKNITVKKDVPLPKSSQSNEKTLTVDQTIDMKHRYLHLAQRSISMIITNSTKRWDPSYVLRLYPQLITSLMLAFCGRKPSVRRFRQLVQVQHGMLLFLQKYPELLEDLEGRLARFIEEPEKRLKEHTPALGDLLAYLLATERNGVKELMLPYQEESRDRQMFWIIKEVPELVPQTAHEANLEDDEMLKTRCDIIYKQQKRSFAIFATYYSYV